MLRDEQCKKVCRILDDALANRPTERDTLIVAVRTAFDGLKERKKGRWIYRKPLDVFECSVCGSQMVRNIFNYCPWCGAKMMRMKEEGKKNDL